MQLSQPQNGVFAKRLSALRSNLFGGNPHGNNRADRNYQTIVTVFFVLVLLLGCHIFRDYGVSLDEPRNIIRGAYAFDGIIKLIAPHFYQVHVAPHLAGLPPDASQDYGVFFELPLAFIELAFRMSNPQHVFYMRHFATFLMFFISLIFFFRLCREHFQNWRMGLLGCLLLLISPRIFAQAFYNSKDIVFMSLLIIAVYAMKQFLHSPSRKTVIWFALVSAAAIDVRIMGVLVPFIAVFVIVVKLLRSNNKSSELRRWLWLSVLYVIVTAVTIIVCWPHLWSTPAENFLTSFQSMSKFQWLNTCLFMGRVITPSVHLPWYYIPVWIVISTPVLYTVLFFIGLLAILGKLFKAKTKFIDDENSRDELIFLALFLLPLIAVVVLRSVLYDAWRQLYFIYPMFLLIALTGFVRLLEMVRGSAVLKYVLVGITATCMAFTAAFMLRNHPYEDTYFSFLPNSAIEKGFERDYWGLSCRKGLEYILSHDTARLIRIKFSPFASANQHILPDDAQKRLQVEAPTDTIKPDYIMSNYRWVEQPFYANKEVKQETYSIKVDGLKILSVFRQ